MEIEFSPNQMSTPGTTNVAKTRPLPADSNGAPPLQGVAELQKKLNQEALSRPEKIAAARQVLSDVKYPPDQLLNGIAHLLAIKLNQ